MDAELENARKTIVERTSSEWAAQNHEVAHAVKVLGRKGDASDYDLLDKLFESGFVSAIFSMAELAAKTNNESRAARSAIGAMANGVEKGIYALHAILGSDTDTLRKMVESNFGRFSNAVRQTVRDFFSSNGWPLTPASGPEDDLTNNDPRIRLAALSALPEDHSHDIYAFLWDDDSSVQERAALMVAGKARSQKEEVRTLVLLSRHENMAREWEKIDRLDKETIGELARTIMSRSDPETSRSWMAECLARVLQSDAVPLLLAVYGVQNFVDYPNKTEPLPYPRMGVRVRPEIRYKFPLLAIASIPGRDADRAIIYLAHRAHFLDYSVSSLAREVLLERTDRLGSWADSPNDPLITSLIQSSPCEQTTGVLDACGHPWRESPVGVRYFERARKAAIRERGGCPGCGGPFNRLTGGTCPQCGYSQDAPSMLSRRPGR